MSPAETVSIDLAGAKVTIPSNTIAELWLARLGKPSVAPKIETPAPLFGASLDGGFYAGVTLHDGVPKRLVLLPGDHKGTWDNARAWAAERDGELPSRIDQLVLWQNMREQFEQTWYWSSEQYAPDAGCAWCQSFYNGYQFRYLKSAELRARAVRRLPL